MTRRRQAESLHDDRAVHTLRPGWLRGLVMVAVDSAALLVSGAIAYLAWARPLRGQPAAMYLDLAPIVILFVLGYGQMGLYSGFGLPPAEQIRRSSLVTGFLFLALATGSFVLKLPHRYSRMTFGIAALLSLILVPLARSLAARWLARAGRFGAPALVIGDQEPVSALESLLARRSDLGLRPVEILRVEEEAAGVPLLGLDLGNLEPGRHDAARVVVLVGVAARHRERVNEFQQLFRSVLVVQGWEALPTSGSRIREIDGALGLELTNNLLYRRNRWAKRVLDIVLSGLLLVLAAPLVAVVGVLVKLLSPGPVLYWQEREGLGGRALRVPKIRTMHLEAEARLEAVLNEEPARRDEWERARKLRRDPRLIPGLGRWLRRFSLDELPQLWTILQGGMSLVGPRPFPGYHLAAFSEPFRRLRRQVRPGLTGLWQIEVRSEGGVEEQEAHDTYYIRNWSLWLDLYILARTVTAVLSGRGAY